MERNYSTEILRFGVEMSIVLPGAFINGRSYFIHSDKLDTEEEVVAKYFGEGKPYEACGKVILACCMPWSGRERTWVDFVR